MRLEIALLLEPLAASGYGANEHGLHATLVLLVAVVVAPVGVDSATGALEDRDVTCARSLLSLGACNTNKDKKK